MLNNQIINRRFSGSTLVYFIAGLVVLVLAFLVIDNYILTNESELITEQAMSPVVEPTEAMDEIVAGDVKPVLHNSVAILPFENLSPNSDDAYVAFGIHQDLLYILSLVQDMSVIAHNGVFNTDINYINKDIVGELKYPTDMPLADITSELNVGTIMKGSVRYADEQIIVDVHLYDASGNNEIWSEKYERDFSEIFAIQTEIAESITMTLGANLSEAEKARIRKPLANSIEAYKLYLKGRVLISHIEATPIELSQYLDEAIAVDPDFALVHGFKASAYGLALVNGSLSNLSSVDKLEKVVVTHTEKALELDPDLCFGHWAQAMIHYTHGRTEEARQAYERALQLGPGVIEILNGYAHFLSFHEEHDKAISLVERSQELVPTDTSWLVRLAMILMFAGESDAAVDIYSEGLKYYQFPWLFRLIGITEYQAGNRDEAIKQLRIAEQKQVEVGRAPDPYTVYAYSILGLKEEATRLANELEANYAKRKHVNATNAILINLVLGKVDQAYDVLSKNLNWGVSRNLQYIKINFMNDPVLDEPRFVELRNRIGALD